MLSLSFFILKSPDFSLTTKVVFTFLTSMAFIVSFLGNSMVIYIIRKDQLLKSTTFLLILNMACGDLVTTSVTCPPLIKFLFVGLAWIPGTFGSLLCKLNLYLVLVAFLGCIFSLVGIQIDRFLAVIRPLKHLPWRKWTKVIIPAIWLAAILLPIRHMWHETGVQLSTEHFRMQRRTSSIKYRDHAERMLSASFHSDAHTLSNHHLSSVDKAGPRRTQRSATTEGKSYGTENHQNDGCCCTFFLFLLGTAIYFRLDTSSGWTGSRHFTHLVTSIYPLATSA